MDNTELIKLVDELRALPKENEYVEFKSGNATTNERFGMYISAISNAACIHNNPFGYLVFGIDDATHAVEGTKFRFQKRKEGNSELEIWVRRLLYPSIKFEFLPCDYEGHYLEIFKIPAAVGEPTYFKNTPYIRFGSSLTELKKYPQYIKVIYNSQDDWSAKIIESATINDLDSEAISLAREKFKEKMAGKPFFDDIDRWSDETFLDKARITLNGKITNTAIILLGKPESSHYILPGVAQITWKLDTEEKAYEHFGIPFFITVNDVLKQIRNVKYKFFPRNQLVAVEVQKYDPEVILEALNNCIAHQEYNYNSRIVLTEQTGKLIFANAGNFFEGNAEDYTTGNKTPKKYRNRWLAEAMVTLKMIDSLGYGIHKMYKSQMQRYFPLPDYSKSTWDEVVLEIYGHAIDENYSKLLIERKGDIDLTDAVLLDKVQKSLPINGEAARKLKQKGFIEGRKPNYFISAQIADITDKKAQYTRNKGLDTELLKSFILKHIEIHGYATRKEIDELLLDKMPDYLDERQRKKRIDNIIQNMRDDTIVNLGTRSIPKWVIKKD
ncbi:putative DNA binding domain-containing protein [Petrimonas sulfuriphila]|uniref:RNA-binding domain-containing protein n=1 Tax=Petrimonas sulfuriphila TaxID=285070 RepID=UPI00324628B0